MVKATGRSVRERAVRKSAGSRKGSGRETARHSTEHSRTLGGWIQARERDRGDHHVQRRVGNPGGIIIRDNGVGPDVERKGERQHQPVDKGKGILLEETPFSPEESDDGAQWVLVQSRKRKCANTPPASPGTGHVELCHKCNRRGHRRPECRNEWYCYNCRGWGHIATHCPSPDRRERRSTHPTLPVKMPTEKILLERKGPRLVNPEVEITPSDMGGNPKLATHQGSLPTPAKQVNPMTPAAPTHQGNAPVERIFSIPLCSSILARKGSLAAALVAEVLMGFVTGAEIGDVMLVEWEGLAPCVRPLADKLFIITGATEDLASEYDGMRLSTERGGSFRLFKWGPELGCTALPTEGEWIRAKGIPLHLWDISVFRRLVKPFGILMEVDENTRLETVVDEARLKIAYLDKDKFLPHLPVEHGGHIYQVTLEREETWRAAVHPHRRSQHEMLRGPGPVSRRLVLTMDQSSSTNYHPPRRLSTESADLSPAKRRRSPTYGKKTLHNGQAADKDKTGRGMEFDELGPSRDPAKAGQLQLGQQQLQVRKDSWTIRKYRRFSSWGKSRFPRRGGGMVWMRKEASSAACATPQDQLLGGKADTTHVSAASASRPGKAVPTPGGERHMQRETGKTDAPSSPRGGFGRGLGTAHFDWAAHGVVLENKKNKHEGNGPPTAQVTAASSHRPRDPALRGKLLNEPQHVPVPGSNKSDGVSKTCSTNADRRSPRTEAATSCLAALKLKSDHVNLMIQKKAPCGRSSPPARLQSDPLPQDPRPSSAGTEGTGSGFDDMIDFNADEDDLLGEELEDFVEETPM